MSEGLVFNMVGGGIKLSAIDVITAPAKTIYTVGDIFDPAGMVVEATYTNGSTANVTGYTCSPTALNTVGTQAITVSYTERGVTKTVTLTVTVERKRISAVPSQSGTLTYSGSAQSPSWSNYDSSKMTLGGVTSGTNAGSYNAIFTPKDDYCWSDGSTTVKTVSWTIGKAVGSLSLSATSVVLNSSAKSKTVTVTRAGDGAISAQTSDTSVATVSVSGNVVTIQSVNDKTGTATITISVAAGTNHTAPSNKTISVTATFVSNVLNDKSWETIRSVSDKGTGANYWAIGDKKTITINGKIGSTTFSSLSMDVFILGFNHNSAKEGRNRIHFLIGMNGTKIVGLFDSKYGPDSGWKLGTTGNFVMNTSQTNSDGWNGSYMRKTLLGNSNAPTSPLANSYMAALPSDLRAVMKSVKKYSDNTGGDFNMASYVTATTDYLFLLAEFEVYGSCSFANSAERKYQLQYDYFKNGNSKIAYKYNDTGTAVYWWLRSTDSGTITAFCDVLTNGNASSHDAHWSLALVPGFVV